MTRTTIHLVGQQPAPVYMGIRQFEADHHWLVASRQSRPEAERVATLAAAEGIRVEVLEIDPFDVGACASAMEPVWAAGGGASGSVGSGAGAPSVTFNLTGGTKPMFAAGMALAARWGVQAFYLDTAHRLCRELTGDFAVSRLRPWLSIDTFFALAGYRVQDPGHWDSDPRRQERAELTRALWTVRDQIRKRYGYLHKILGPNLRSGEPFWAKAAGVSIELRADDSVEARVGDRSFRYSDWPDCGRYVLGGWLEEYIYLGLEPLLAHGVLKDLRMGLAPEWNEASASGMSAHEFDVVYTDGYQLFIVECKAGIVKQDHIQKLENNVQAVGGSFGRGVLASVTDLNPTNRRRVAKSRTIDAYAGAAVETTFLTSGALRQAG